MHDRCLGLWLNRAISNVSYDTIRISHDAFQDNLKKSSFLGHFLDSHGHANEFGFANSAEESLDGASLRFSFLQAPCFYVDPLAVWDLSACFRVLRVVYGNRCINTSIRISGHLAVTRV